MKRPTLRSAIGATALAAALVGGPAVLAPDTTDTQVSALEAVNPVRADTAEAYWWHFTVRKWGGVCGYVWINGNKYEVKRWAYSWTSDHPTCQRTGTYTYVYR